MRGRRRPPGSRSAGQNWAIVICFRDKTGRALALHEPALAFFLSRGRSERDPGSKHPFCIAASGRLGGLMPRRGCVSLLLGSVCMLVMVQGLCVVLALQAAVAAVDTT